MSEAKYSIKAENIWKRFNHGYIFRKINFSISSGEILAVSGINGSGKTTFLKILAGLTAPDKGRIVIYRGEEKISAPYSGIVGYLGPYMELYDKLTALENLQFFATQLQVDKKRSGYHEILEIIGLEGRGNDYVENFSSGMKQRMKYALLMLKKFPVILLDEPTANFDAEGKKLFRSFVEENRDSVIVIAGNEEEEIALGNVRVDLS